MASKSLKAVSGRRSASAVPASISSTLASTEGTGFNLAQEQMQVLISLADVVFKCAEEVRRCQLDAAHAARERHERAHADVAAAGNPTELLTVQAELARYDLEAGSRYWQQLSAIWAATQADAMNLITRSAAHLGGDMAKLAATSPVAAKPASTSPVAHSEADANQAWNQWVDLGKQWTDMLYRTEAALH